MAASRGWLPPPDRKQPFHPPALPQVVFRVAVALTFPLPKAVPLEARSGNRTSQCALPHGVGPASMPTPLAHDRFARAGARQSHVMCACVACGTPATPLPHLHQDRAHPCHICTGTRLTPPTSAAPELESSLPRLHRDWAHPCHSACVHVRVRACVRAFGGRGGRCTAGLNARETSA